MANDEHDRRNLLQALAALPLAALAVPAGRAMAQAGGSPVKVDTKGLVAACGFPERHQWKV